LSANKIAAIILARGGSKGIPSKNITEFCGKPLIAWTIAQCLEANIADVYVSSDSLEILEISSGYGAVPLTRPKEISGDLASSEDGWLHALDTVKAMGKDFDWCLAPQVTSPLRHSTDIIKGIKLAFSGKYDSLFSCCVAEDLFIWKHESGVYDSVNYNWKNRKRRQDFGKQFVENGSFYLFQPNFFRVHKNRLGGKIGIVEMEFWKMFEIDSHDDLRLCSTVMKEFILD
jgi:CMP-N,N'-diacetyllegionaminic acid synthase